MKICRVTNCNSKVHARALCKRHWQQWYRKSGSTANSLRPEYSVWRNMKTRCYNPNYNESEHYMGRNIKVCDRWLNSFETFLSDVGERPGEGYSIDRISNDGDYEPGNVRWATRTQQANNKQSGNRYGFTGIKKRELADGGTKWISSISVKGRYIHLGMFDTKREAIKARKVANIKFNRK